MNTPNSRSDSEITEISQNSLEQLVLKEAVQIYGLKPKMELNKACMEKVKERLSKYESKFSKVYSEESGKSGITDQSEVDTILNSETETTDTIEIKYWHPNIQTPLTENCYNPHMKKMNSSCSCSKCVNRSCLSESKNSEDFRKLPVKVCYEDHEHSFEHMKSNNDNDDGNKLQSELTIESFYFERNPIRVKAGDEEKQKNITDDDDDSISSQNRDEKIHSESDDDYDDDSDRNNHNLNISPRKRGGGREKNDKQNKTQKIYSDLMIFGGVVKVSDSAAKAMEKSGRKLHYRKLSSTSRSKKKSLKLSTVETRSTRLSIKSSKTVIKSDNCGTSKLEVKEELQIEQKEEIQEHITLEENNQIDMNGRHKSGIEKMENQDQKNSTGQNSTNANSCSCSSTNAKLSNSSLTTPIPSTPSSPSTPLLPRKKIEKAQRQGGNSVRNDDIFRQNTTKDTIIKIFPPGLKVTCNYLTCPWKDKHQRERPKKEV